MCSDRSLSTNSQEHTRLLQALRESEMLRELAELLASSLDILDILQTLVRRTTAACEVERCAVWLYDETQKCFLPSAYHFSTQILRGKALQVVDRIWRNSSLPLHDTLIQRLLDAHGLLYLENLDSETSIKNITSKFFVRSALLVALVRDERILGIMSLDNPYRFSHFTQQQQQLARAIGQQATLAIDNARLYQQAQNERRRAQRLTERAHAIHQVAMAANSGEDLTATLNIALEQLARGAVAKHTALTLLEDNQIKLDQTILYPKKDISNKQTYSFSLADLPICQKAIDLRQPYFMTWKQLTHLEQQWFRTLGMQHILAVPLFTRTPISHSSQSKEMINSLTSPHCIGFVFVGYEHAQPPSLGKTIFARDITTQCALAIEKARILDEARQALALATEHANMLDATFNAMNDGILVLDQDGKIVHHNAPAAHFFRFPPQKELTLQEHLESQTIKTLNGQPIPPHEQPWQRALQGIPIRGEHFLHVDSEGAEHVIEMNIAPLGTSQAQPEGIVSAFRDITLQVQTERRIRLALDTMLHAAEAVSGLTDLREILYRVLAMTLAALNCERGVIQLYDHDQEIFTPLHALGFEAGEVEQWLEQQQCWPSPKLHQYSGFYAQLLEGHATILTLNPSNTLELTTSDTHTQVLVAPITHGSELLGVLLLDHTPHTRTVNKLNLISTGFNAWDIAIVEGIGQFAGLAIEQTHWRHEAEIARTNEASMRESNALKDEFLAITAHEFRTPLTVILAHSQMMIRQLHKSSSDIPIKLKNKFDESLTSIETQARQLTNIVNTFLEVTRLNRGQITLTKEEISLETIVKEIIAQHSATVTIHTIDYRIEPSPYPYILLGDRARIAQILTNLLQNAIKYSPLGGPITIIVGRQETEDGNSLIEVCVEDKGIGIPKEAQLHLFERFYRVPNIGGSQTRGVGLGLYLVAQFLHLHGGNIRVESNGIEGEGSRFIFTLPLAHPASNPSSSSMGEPA